MLTFAFIIGIVGMALLLIAFISDLLKKYTEDTVLYNIMNIFGAIFLLYYAYTIQSIPFIILNAVWSVSAFFELLKVLRKPVLRKPKPK